MQGIQVNVPPPRWSVPPPRLGFTPPGFQNFRPNYAIHQFQPRMPAQQPNNQANQASAAELDAKRPVRKSTARKTVDYNAAILHYLEARVWQRARGDRRAIQPDSIYYADMTPPQNMLDNPTNAVTTKFVRASTNKMRCPIFCCVWTPEGRRLITGASSGEFTLWNGLTFNFETILQAHDASVRSMVWSHNDLWMVTGDYVGFVKYWQSNMNNVKMFQAHKEAIRGISFCPTDTKVVTCSDDGTVRLMDFYTCVEEKILRGHGGDVKSVDWHPQKGLIVSGSKDSQQPIKLWDPRTGQGLATIHVHKNTVMCTKFNRNGNWLLTGSRDHLLKVFDIRNFNQELQTFRGHKKEVCSVAWHPIHETLFSSGGSDGSIMFWDVGTDKEVGSMEQAHDGIVWTLSWHPLGHILCSGSNDHTSKFWTRNRPGDKMRDKYNLNIMPKGTEESAEIDEQSSAVSGTPTVIPGMGLEKSLLDQLKPEGDTRDDVIPGLDFNTDDLLPMKKVPFAKPIPKSFQQQWMENKRPVSLLPPPENESDSVMPNSVGMSKANKKSQNAASASQSTIPTAAHMKMMPPPMHQGPPSSAGSGKGNSGSRWNQANGSQPQDDKPQQMPDKTYPRSSKQQNSSNQWTPKSKNDKDDRMRNHSQDMPQGSNRFKGKMSNSQWAQQNYGDKDDRAYSGPTSNKFRGDSDFRRENAQMRADKDDRQHFRQALRNNNDMNDADDRPMPQHQRPQPIIRYNKEGFQDSQRKRQWNSGPGADSNNYNSGSDGGNYRNSGADGGNYRNVGDDGNNYRSVGGDSHNYRDYQQQKNASPRGRGKYMSRGRGRRGRGR